MEDSRLQASHMLQSSLQSNGDRRYATPPQQIAAYNRNSVPQCNDTPMQPPFEPLPSSVDIIFGEKVIHGFSFKLPLSFNCPDCTFKTFFSNTQHKLPVYVVIEKYIIYLMV